MASFLRVVAVAAGLGSWVLVLVGAGVGQSLHAPGDPRAPGTAAGRPPRTTAGSLSASLPPPTAKPASSTQGSGSGSGSAESGATDRSKSGDPAPLDLKN